MLLKATNGPPPISWRKINPKRPGILDTIQTLSELDDLTVWTTTLIFWRRFYSSNKLALSSFEILTNQLRLGSLNCSNGFKLIWLDSDDGPTTDCVDNFNSNHSRPSNQYCGPREALRKSFMHQPWPCMSILSNWGSMLTSCRSSAEDLGMCKPFSGEYDRRFRWRAKVAAALATQSCESPRLCPRGFGNISSMKTFSSERKRKRQISSLPVFWIFKVLTLATSLSLLPDLHTLTH